MTKMIEPSAKYKLIKNIDDILKICGVQICHPNENNETTLFCLKSLEGKRAFEIISSKSTKNEHIQFKSETPIKEIINHILAIDEIKTSTSNKKLLSLNIDAAKSEIAISTKRRQGNYILMNENTFNAVSLTDDNTVLVINENMPNNKILVGYNSDTTIDSGCQVAFMKENIFGMQARPEYFEIIELEE